MNIAGSVRQLIAEDATAFALVGDRVFPIVAPTDTQTPFVVVRVDKTIFQSCHDGTLKSKVSKVQVCLISVAATAKEAADCDAAIQEVMDGYLGMVTFKGESIYYDHWSIADKKEDWNDIQKSYVVISDYHARIIP